MSERHPFLHVHSGRDPGEDAFHPEFHKKSGQQRSLRSFCPLNDAKTYE